MRLIDDELRALLAPPVAACGFELWDVHLSRTGGRAVLEVHIDHPAGVTLEDCREISLRLADVLDKADPIPGEFTLEVASPGIERTLRNRGDLERFEGSLARVSTRSPIDGFTQHDGRLAGVDGASVRLRLGDGTVRAIPFEAIRRAKLLYDPESERAAPPRRAAGGGRERA